MSGKNPVWRIRDVYPRSRIQKQQQKREVKKNLMSYLSTYVATNFTKLYIILQCGGSGMFIPNPGSDFFPSRIPYPNCLHPGSRILKEFKYFNPKKAKKWFLSSKNYDPGCSSWIPDPNADFLPSRIPGTKRHPIPDPGS